MPAYDDDDDDSLSTDPRDIQRFDGDTIPCPECGKQIYAEADRCPHCKIFLTGGERTDSHKKPLWFRITAWICILLFSWWLIIFVVAYAIHWWHS